MSLPTHPAWLNMRFRDPKTRRCRWCLEVLTAPESIERGYGPSCWERVQPVIAGRGVAQ